MDDARLHDWFAAEQRIARQPEGRQAVLAALTDQLVAELARRVGRPFRFEELVAEYDRGTDWAVAELTERAPGQPWAWAPDLAVDAAFARYARHASDVGGGRRIARREE